MKFGTKALGLLMAAGSLLGASSAQANLCLQQATNAELVNELSRRLHFGGGGGNGGLGGAQATCRCDLYGDLQLGLIGPTGSEAKADVTVRNAQTCARQRDVLSQFRSRITQISLVGVCDLYGDLQRFSLTPDGTFKRLSEVTIRNVETCLRQADAMNRN
jgi:hypothetical protein